MAASTIARRVVQPEVLGRDEFERIRQARSRARAGVTELIGNLRELEAALGGRAESLVARAPEVRPRIGWATSLLADTLAVPSASADQGTPDILTLFAKYGLRDRSFDKVVPVTAPQPINDTGSSFDAGEIYDAWILNPNIDTKIDFNRAPNQNTPFISANSRMQFMVRAQKVYYQSNVQGLTGTMQVWLLKFSGT